jgi:hypothetical protein
MVVGLSSVGSPLVYSLSAANGSLDFQTNEGVESAVLVGNRRLR